MTHINFRHRTLLKMTNYVISLFPTGVYKSSILTLDDDTVKHINTYAVRKNQANVYSEDSYCLSSERFSELSAQLAYHLNEYFKFMYKPKGDVSPYITQSWFNWTGKNQSHHRHIHSNSIISGVYYVRTQELDAITFYRENINQAGGSVDIGLNLSMQTTGYNEFTTGNMDVPVKDGDLILFPSSLQHGVKQRDGDNLRISIAFNSFVRGKIGDYGQLNELKL